MSHADAITLGGDLISKNDDLRQVTGWASVVTKGGQPYRDLQGDIIPMPVLRKAVTAFLDDARTGGYMHQRGEDGTVIRVGKIVNSFVVDAAMAKALKMDTDLEGWLVTIQIEDDEVWQAVKRGAIGGFSIGGRGRRRVA